MFNDLVPASAVHSPGTDVPLAPVRFVRPLRGRSNPSLVECTDGRVYIVKAAGNPLRPNLVANEFLGSAMASSLGLPVPTPRSVLLSAAFVQEEYDQRLRLNEGRHFTVKPGLHYASQMVGSPVRHLTYSYIPRCRAPYVRNLRTFLGMYVLDRWAKHLDMRQAVFVEEKLSRRINVVFIDHGDMFGGPTWDFIDGKQDKCHSTYQYYSYLWTRKAVNSWVKALRDKLPRALSDAVVRLPRWSYTGDLNALQLQLEFRLRHLGDIVEQNLAESIAKGYLHDKLYLQGSGICDLQPQE